jgi:dihydrofolate synthase/folylpolyglutamate synthase
LSRSLEQWLDHQTQVHPQAIDMGLDRLREVLQRLDWQQPTVPVITVAGTNGKGSVTAYCAAILSAAGYRVGTFNSPHLLDYRERVGIAGRLVTADELIRAFERIEEARLRGPELSLTFFEYNALAAFLIFAECRMDAWVLEVGMGGRLDAVNAVDPSVAVVVSIGLDHQEFLGTTLDAIACEKAGIFRTATPAVLGDRNMPTALASVAAKLGARLKQPGVDFDFSALPDAWHYRGPRWDLPGLPIPALRGAAQIANAATAIAALEELESRLTVSPGAIAQGLRTVRLTGRFQIVSPATGPQWILDVAHNPDAARVLARSLEETPHAGRTLAVCSILADKDAPAIARQLRDSFAAWWLTAIEGARGSTAAELAARLKGELSVPLMTADDIASACCAALAYAEPHDRIVVFGSFHTVGPALDWLDRRGLLPQAAVPEYTQALPRQ